MYDAIPERRGRHDTVLGIEELDGDVFARPVAALFQRPLETQDLTLKVRCKRRGARLSAFGEKRLHRRATQAPECGDLAEEVVAPSRHSAGLSGVALWLTRIVTGRLFLPPADEPADVVELAGGVLVAAFVDALEVEGETEEMAELLYAEIGGGQRLLAIAVVGRLDEPVQPIERCRHDAVAQRELVRAREALDDRRAPLQECMHGLDGGAETASGFTHALALVEAAGKSQYVFGMDTLTPDAIARLSPEERFDLIDKLWDSLGEKDWALTPAQSEELARRLETFDADRTEGVAWEDLRDDLLSLK